MIDSTEIKQKGKTAMIKNMITPEKSKISKVEDRNQKKEYELKKITEENQNEEYEIFQIEDFEKEHQQVNLGNLNQNISRGKFRFN